MAQSVARPQVVAHRGSSAVKAEHTLEAYVTALDEGADALECDVRLTADGHLVCVHDRSLRRTAATKGLVSNMELAELERLDFSQWKNPWADLDDEVPDRDLSTGGILTMKTLLETAADYSRRIELAIETKHPTRYGGLVEKRLVELLDDFGWTGPDSPARVMSFSPVALRRVRKMAPALQLVQLLESPHQWPLGRPIAERDWIAGPGIKLLRKHPDLLRRIRAHRTRLHVWTVNTDDDVDFCLEHGVEAIITDRPAAVLGRLDALLPG